MHAWWRPESRPAGRRLYTRKEVHNARQVLSLGSSYIDGSIGDPFFALYGRSTSPLDLGLTVRLYELLPSENRTPTGQLQTHQYVHYMYR